jgi:hypothetical protein
MSDTGSEYDYDVDQEGQELDENLTADYPPDQPIGLYDEEATGLAGPGSADDGSDLDDTEPEVWEAEEGSAAAPVLEGDADVGVVDTEADLVAEPVVRDDVGPLADDDEFSGDETRRDVATEHVPPSAEEAAVRYDDDPPGATG